MPRTKPVDNANKRKTTRRRLQPRNKRIEAYMRKQKHGSRRNYMMIQNAELQGQGTSSTDLLLPTGVAEERQTDGRQLVNEAAGPTGAVHNVSTSVRMRLEDFIGMPEDISRDQPLWPFWKKRHSLFWRFDEGIILDRESWFSVTPEVVATQIAERCQYDVIVDAFCGPGGNTIQFARAWKKTVYAIDIDPKKIELARNNAQVYGVQDYIVFIVGDFFKIAPHLKLLKPDMVFLSPPWGGLNYTKNRPYDIETELQPRSASELMRVARTLTSTITLYLPRNSNREQIEALAQEEGFVDIQDMMGGPTGRSFIALTAYFEFDDILPS